MPLWDEWQRLDPLLQALIRYWQNQMVIDHSASANAWSRPLGAGRNVAFISQIVLLSTLNLYYHFHSWSQNNTFHKNVLLNIHVGAIQVLRNAFFLEIWPLPPPRNANNVEPYTFVTLFSGKADTLSPSALRNTWMATLTTQHYLRDSSLIETLLAIETPAAI